MSTYIDDYRGRFGVEPICHTLAIAPSSYYAAKVRPPSARAIRDAELKIEISRIHAANFGVYGVRKLWRRLRREGMTTAPCVPSRLTWLTRGSQPFGFMTYGTPTPRSYWRRERTSTARVGCSGIAPSPPRLFTRIYSRAWSVPPLTALMHWLGLVDRATDTLRTH